MCSTIQDNVMSQLSCKFAGSALNKYLLAYHVNRCDMAFIEPMHRNKPNITYHVNKVI